MKKLLLMLALFSSVAHAAVPNMEDTLPTNYAGKINDLIINSDSGLVYSSENVLANGKYVEYKEIDGNEFELYFTFKDGKQIGDFKVFTGLTGLIATGTYSEDGKPTIVKYYTGYTGKEVLYYTEDYENAPDGYDALVTYYNERGDVTSISTIIKGKKEGKFKKFYSDGSLQEVGNYKDNHIVGEVITYDEAGNIKLKIDYATMEKQQTYTDINTGKEHVGTYTTSVYHGEYRKYYESGKLNHYKKYKYNKPYGEEVFYYENGVEQLTIFHQGDGGTVHRLYATDGTLREYEEKMNGVNHGEYKTFHGNGKLHCYIEYVNGKWHGLMKSFTEEGSLFSEGQYLEGKRQGRHIQNYYSGGLWCENNFVDDKQHGEQNRYNEDGGLYRKEIWNMQSLESATAYGFGDDGDKYDITINYKDGEAYGGYKIYVDRQEELTTEDVKHHNDMMFPQVVL